MIFAKFLLFTNSRRSIQTGITGIQSHKNQLGVVLQGNWWFRSPYHTKISTIKIF